MKRIEAYIQIGKLSEVQGALGDQGIQGLTVTQVKGYGRQMGKTTELAAAKGPILLPKTKIDVVVPDSKLDVAIQAIIDSAITGDIGDGKIFVSDVVEAIRIRTNERGDAALE